MVGERQGEKKKKDKVGGPDQITREKTRAGQKTEGRVREKKKKKNPNVGKKKIMKPKIVETGVTRSPKQR